MEALELCGNSRVIPVIIQTSAKESSEAKFVKFDRNTSKKLEISLYRSSQVNKK